MSQANAHVYATVTPDTIGHSVTDDGWTTFEAGPLRIKERTTDLASVNYGLALAAALALEATRWEAELHAIRDRLEADSRPAPEAVRIGTAPEPDEPFGGDDPDLDRAVEDFVNLTESHRKTGTPEDEA